MSLFEFLMVLVSIIVGLGVAEILTGIARLIRSRESIKGYWVHSVLVTTIFVALLQQWWEIWGLRAAPEWTFPGLLMLLAGPVGLFLIAHLLFPEPMKGANLRKYYRESMRPIWCLATLTVILASLFRPLIFGSDLFVPDNAASFLLVCAFIALATSRRSVHHAVLVPGVFLLVLLDVIQFNFVISPN